MKRVVGHQYLYRRGNSLIFRRGVPQDVRHAFDNKSEVHVSLGASSIPAARHSLHRELTKFEKKVASARGSRPPAEVALVTKRLPSREEMHTAVRQTLVKRLDRVPGFERGDPSASAVAAMREEDLEAFLRDLTRARRPGSSGPTLNTVWTTEQICQEHGWLIEEGTPLWWTLIDLVSRTQAEAAERQLQELQGRPQRTVDEIFSPEFYRLDQDRRAKVIEPVPIWDLFDDWVDNREPRPSTVKAFRRQLKAFCTFAEHTDAARIGRSDVMRWVEELKRRNLSAKTIGETYLPAVRLALQRGVDKALLAENAASRITVLGPKTDSVRKGFREEEALTILRATLGAFSAKLSPERALARRWVPWLCAYTGARVNELTQLRGEDIAQIDGIWTLRITPEAGTTKNGKERIVALHPHLIEQGFVGAMKDKAGPIFYDPERRRNGSDENPQAKKVGEHLAKWVRQLGVDDPRVQPNHAWRHLFKTLAREHSMDKEVRDYIQGHATRTEGEGYGETPIRVTLREIQRLPAYVIGCERSP